jgi:hypothetical protein
MHLQTDLENSAISVDILFNIIWKKNLIYYDVLTY